MDEETGQDQEEDRCSQLARRSHLFPLDSRHVFVFIEHWLPVVCSPGWEMGLRRLAVEGTHRRRKGEGKASQVPDQATAGRADEGGGGEGVRGVPFMQPPEKQRVSKESQLGPWAAGVAGRGHWGGAAGAAGTSGQARAEGRTHGTGAGSSRAGLSGSPVVTELGGKGR